MSKTIEALKTVNEAIDTDTVVVGHLMIILLLGENGKMTMPQVKEALNLSDKYVSRAAMRLGFRHEGLGYLSVTTDRKDCRQKVLSLSSKGKEIYDKFKETLEG